MLKFILLMLRKRLILFVLISLISIFVNSCVEDFVKNGRINETGSRVAREALSHLGETFIDFDGNKIDFDCSGFVRFVFMKSVGVDLDKYLIKRSNSKVESYYYSFKVEYSGKFKVMPGDLIFFDNTYDRNKNKFMDDELTHVGLVVGYDRDTGSIVFVDKSKGKSVSLGYINFSYPDNDYIVKDGKTLQVNSYVRGNKNGDDSKLLSSQAFRGFGRVKVIPFILGE